MPVHNEDIAVIFEEMADLLEIEDANPFRVRAYRNAARTVRGLARPLAEMVADGEDLTRLPTIGKDLAAKIIEIVATGHAKALENLHEEVPVSLEALLRIPGLGPRRVKALYQELHIKTLRQLESAARQGQLQELPGFGAKLEQQILATVSAHRTTERRFLYRTARAYAEPLRAWLEAAPGVHEVVIAGSYRRGKETVGDLDILVTAKANSPVMQHFVDYDEVQDVVAKGPTRATVFLHSGLQVDLRVVEKNSFGAALYYFTGSKAHNIQVRRRAQQRGLKINEYGVFKGDKRIAGETEASVFKAVGLPFIPPELREAHGEVEAAEAKRLPKLITRQDLQGDLHVHTDATDGHNTLEEMARAAKQRGLEYIAITDHSRHLTVAHGLDEKRLHQQLEQIDRLNAKLKGFTILKGIEVDILEDGSLDLPDNVLSQLDLVIGAIHHKFHLSLREQTTRILRAIDSKYFTMLAHPSGRLLEERDAYEVDIPRIIEATRERGCYLELNSQPQRLDLIDTYCQLAKQQGVLVSINSDAHSPDNFDYLEGGINQARRGWLEKNDVLNTCSLRELRKRLKATMG
ncbi:DNA polymerase/3'-5' exonuclease PolX [Sulfuriflexus mobilis]|uniref:DNA polymerase/3'-5' exonuclease PolX n=1 Tax=Sulfuriflexus mobilis TaxID=1811807 RepID=UPI000F82307B|nr:DNA polymerase/3'-5' exonuclease PolX [Sulfuriflexus mobilis]